MNRPLSQFLDRNNREFLGVRTNREWRKKKRAQLRAVEKAVNKYLVGSAYTPHSALTFPPVRMNLLGLVRHIKEQLSVKNWGK